MTNLVIRQTIAEYFKSQPVSKAWLFGSFARGDQRPDSDVDILISFIPGAKMGLKFFGMINDLEDKLQRPVDLVVEGDLLPFAKKLSILTKFLFMREQTRDKDRLEHIIEAIENVESYTEGIEKDMLSTDKLRLHACI